MTTRSRLVDLRRLPIESATTRNRRTWPPPAAAPPPPQPPAWPALKLGVIVGWQGPWFPLPNWNCSGWFDIPWDNDAGWYHGDAKYWPDNIEIYFHLDLFNGDYFVHMIAWRGEVDIMSISTEQKRVAVAKPFDVTHTEWIGLPLDHTCSGQFYTQP